MVHLLQHVPEIRQSCQNWQLGFVHSSVLCDALLVEISSTFFFAQQGTSVQLWWEVCSMTACHSITILAFAYIMTNVHCTYLGITARAADVLH